MRTAKQIDASRKERASLKTPTEQTLAGVLEATSSSLDYHRERVEHYDTLLRQYVKQAYARKWKDARITAFTGVERPWELTR
jgi:hypothetical protein